MPFKILYVEDNPQNMRLVTKVLTHAGYIPLEAMDGLTGVAVAEREQPNLILMDINLPDISGVEATRLIKERLPHIPIIAVTADAMVGDRDRFLKLGFDEYIPKPIVRREFLATVVNFLKEFPTNANVMPTKQAVVARILYVEDSPDNMRLVCKFLEIEGFEVIEASDGLSGIAAAAREKPDLILMDINLPDIDGIEANSRLKSMPELAKIPVIALTADTYSKTRHYYISRGFDGLIAKPLRRSELITAITRFLDQSRT